MESKIVDLLIVIQIHNFHRRYFLTTKENIIAIDVLRVCQILWSSHSSIFTYLLNYQFLNFKEKQTFHFL